jgi:hypothetical protein
MDPKFQWFKHVSVHPNIISNPFLEVPVQKWDAFAPE